MNIGVRIKNRRKYLGLSVDEVAAKLGKNRATIYRYESNDIENLPISVLEPLAKVLQTTPAYLMGWTNISDNQELTDSALFDLKCETTDSNAREKNSLYESEINDDNPLVILNRGAKNMTRENQERLLKMAKYFFEEDFRKDD